MHIDGQPLLSRATVTSGRILTTFALGIILAKHYEIEPETITLLGAELIIDSLSTPFMWVINFMFIGHLINWYGDWASFYAWNSGKKLQTKSAYGGEATPLPSQIKITLDTLNFVGDQVKQEKLTPQQFKLWEKSTKELIDLRKGVASLSKQAKFVLYGWHLALPLGLAVVAFYMLGADIK